MKIASIIDKGLCLVKILVWKHFRPRGVEVTVEDSFRGASKHVRNFINGGSFLEAWIVVQAWGIRLELGHCNHYMV